LLLALLVLAAVSAYRHFRPPDALLLARQAVEGGAFQVAIEHYLQHLARQPEDWGARCELGLVLSEIDRPQALAEFRKVPPESEAYLDARRQIVALCMSSQRFKEAEEVLLELAEKAPDDFLTQYTLAELYFRQGRAQPALPYAQKSVELDPDHVAAQYLLAEVLDDLGRTAEMIKPLESVVELDLENYGAHLNLAYAYAEAGRPAESRREAEWCLARSPEDINARLFLAEAARDEGHVDEAALEVERALALAPDDLRCRLLEGELLLFQQQAEQALTRLKPLYERHQNDRRVAALLARAAAAAGREAEAAEYRQQVQKLSE